MAFRFYKYEGLGNDFIVLERAELGDRELTDADARALCDRHLGIGADGVLIVGQEPSMHVINADGSVPEMCGNGLRCVAFHLVRKKLEHGPEFTVQTASGAHVCRVHPHDDTHAEVQVQMKAPSFEPRDVPVQSASPWLDEPIEIDGHTLRFTAVSMGNPHLVTFDAVDETRSAIAVQLQNDPRLPRGANVGFASLRGEKDIALSVFERGAGWTQACGTGACAAGAAAVATGRAPKGEPIRVTLPGGELQVTTGDDEPMLMRGPARFVFEGRTS